MIRPEDFYEQEGTLNEGDRRRIWKGIRRSLPAGRHPLLFITDARSFFYGMAAAVLLGFALLGGMQAVRLVQDPPETRLVLAYQSAISQFEAVVPVSTGAPGQAQSGQVQSWKNQLVLVDAAIVVLRLDIRENGPSPVKQTKLRELYALKLQVLQTMIENGGIEL